jgi:asparagine synthase (glutamine-hydrolysing)
MCGIVGVLSGQRLPSAAAGALVSAMASTLRHRGPDDHGIWVSDHAALGHTRLSIIDLSAAGHQPMTDPEGRYRIVYNGEIYNYVELRRVLEDRGHGFRTATDTEVLLRAYMEWGVDALQRLNGMWAFLIWDSERRELFAARDRAGKKPLYWSRDPAGTLYFASEVKALRAAGLRFGMNLQAAFDFLTQGTYGHLSAASFFDGALQVPAGHYLRVRRGEDPQVRCFWDLPIVPARERLRYDAGFRTRFRELLTNAVEIRLRSDVPVGATLSGGLDSSTIVALVDQLTGGAPLHLFTSLFPGSGYDETPYFDAVVARVRQPIVHRAVPSDGGVRERVLAVLEHQEEPFGDTSILAHHGLMEAARAAGVPVVLSGQGGDELLLGYPSMVNAYLGYLLARGRWGSALAELRAWAAARGTSLRRALAAAAPHAIPLSIRDPLRARYVRRHLAGVVSPALRARASLERFTDEPGRSSFDSYLAQVFKRFSIPHLTHYDDRNGMAFAVEGRMPFLDHRLVELAFSVEYDALFQGGFTKRVLREAFSDLLPDSVRARRDKIGFYSPLARWLRGEMAWLERFMTRERLLDVGVLDADRYLRGVRALREGDDRVELEVWRGLIFHLWADRFDIPSLAPVASTRRHHLQPSTATELVGAAASAAEAGRP